MTLYEIIKAVQAAPKKGGHKLAILEQHKDNELLQKYLKAVYDPRITYGITKLPKTTKAGSRELEMAEIQELLDTLANRKLTGKAATTWLKDIAESLMFEDLALLAYIIKRDICADIAEGTILNVWPDLFYIPAYQRCAKMDDKAKKRFAELPYFFVQTKSDGQFSYLLNPSEGVPESMSRAGSLYPAWLAEKLSEGLPKGFVLAGEMLVFVNGVMLDRKAGNGILNSVLSGDGEKFNPNTMEVKYIAWDMLTEAEFKVGRSLRLYEDRLESLDNILRANAWGIRGVSLVRTWKVQSIAEAVVIQNEHLARKEEGTVWKSPILEWRDCSSGDPLMVKAKLTFTADFRIDGVFEGEGKYKGMAGGFNMSSSDNLIKFNVGTGFSDAQRKEYFDNPPIGKIAAIEGNDILTSEGKDTESVFLPVLLEVREDKMVADSREEVWAEFNAARGL